jgi:hypothetical protein
MTNVVNVPFKREYLGELAESMVAIVYTYADRISLAEALGVLELVKAQILEEQRK